MAILLYPTDAAQAQAALAAQHIRSLVGADLSTSFRCISPRVDAESEDEDRRALAAEDALDAHAELTGALAEVLWDLGSNDRSDGQDEERLYIMPVHASVTAHSDPAESLAPVGSAIESIERIVTKLASDDQEQSIGHPLASRIQIIPWIFARAFPSQWPDEVLRLRPQVSDYGPMPILHSPSVTRLDRGDWEVEFRDRLIGDVLWLLPASLDVTSSTQGAPPLLSREPGQPGRQVATTTVARLDWDHAERIARCVLRLMSPGRSDPKNPRSDETGLLKESEEAEDASLPESFDQRVRSALRVPDYPLSLGADVERICATLLPQNFGPMRSTWPRFRDEQWPVLAPPLVLAEIGPKILLELQEVERRALSEGLDAAHDDQLEAVGRVRRAMIEMLRDTAQAAQSPGERVRGQLAFLVAAERTLEAIQREPLPEMIQGASATEQEIPSWIARERGLAGKGLDYPSQGAQWAEFFGFVAVAVALSLATLPLVIAPLALIPIGVAAGGLMLWGRGRQWARYRSDWDELLRDVRNSIPEHMSGVRDLLKQRLYEARLAALGNAISSIRIARRGLLSDADAIGIAAARRRETLDVRQRDIGPEQVGEREKRGLVTLDVANQRDPISASDVAEFLEDRRVLDASHAIEGSVRPLTVEQFEAVLADGISLGKRRSIEKGDAAQLVNAVRRVAMLGWSAPRSNVGTSDPEGQRVRDHSYLFVGQRVVDACGGQLERDPGSYLSDRWDDRPEPRIRLQDTEDSIRGLADDSVLAVRLRLIEVGVASASVGGGSG